MGDSLFEFFVIQLGRLVDFFAKRFFPGIGGSYVSRQLRDRLPNLDKELGVDEAAVEVKWVTTDEEGGEFYRIQIRGSGSIPESLTVSAISPIFGATPRADRITFGDTIFDRLVAVHGPEPVALALLSESTRSWISSLVRDFSGSIGEGSVRLLSGPHYSVENFDQTVRFALNLAVALSRSGSLPERLAANAAKDPIPEVRLRNLQVLLSHFPRSPEAAAAAQKALSDASPHVRLEGASFLGPAGTPALRAIIDAERMPEEIVARGLRLLGSLLPAAEAAAILLEAARWRRGAPRLIAIELLGSLRHAPATGTLAVLLDEGDGEVAGSAARALGQINGTESVLVRALRRRQTEALTDVVDALGLGASVSAVPDLLDVLQDAKVPSRLRQAARDAVRSIQARAAGASAGQVAIAEAPDPEGSLSLVDDEAPRGALALTDATE